MIRFTTTRYDSAYTGRTQTEGAAMPENSLRKLRREAGFTSARAFAEHIGIPAPTYAKYEQMDDGPDTPMPIKNAWTIADALGCSIDALVGRSASGPDGDSSGALVRRLSALTADNRRLVADFIEIAEKRDAKDRERVRKEIAAKYEPYLGEFVAQFLETFDLGEEDDAVKIIGGEATFRALFKSFVEGRAINVMRDEQEKKFEEARKIYESLGYAVHEEFEPTYSATKVKKGEDGYDEALAEVLQGVKEGFDRYAEFRAKEVVDGVMAAYDEAHPRRERRDGGGNVEYALVRMPE